MYVDLKPAFAVMLFNDLSTFEKRFLNVKLVFEIGALKPRF
jgi:hypothetical protein